MQPPVFVQEAETSWTSLGFPQTTRTTSSFNVQAGDVLVAYCMLENGDQSASISGGSQSWSQVQQVSAGAGYARVYAWTTTVDADKSMTVSFTKSSTSSFCFGGNVLMFRGSDGIGASAKRNISAGALEDVDLNLETTQDNSAVVVAMCDWEALNGASRNWKTNGGAFTELTYQYVSGQYTVYGGYHADTGSAATREYGLTSPLDLTYSIVAVEVLGTAELSPYVGSPSFLPFFV